MIRIPVAVHLASPKFVWYWLQSPMVRDYIIKNAKGSSPTMKKISQRILRNDRRHAERRDTGS